MGQHNGARGGQRGINAAVRRATVARDGANSDFAQTHQYDSPAQQAANRTSDDLAAQRRNRARRGVGKHRQG